MARLKPIGILRKLRWLMRRAYDYVRFYLTSDGWVSAFSLDGGAFTRVRFPRGEKWHRPFCADPFIFVYQGLPYLFYETLNTSYKGVLGCFRLEDGEWVHLGKVLEEPFHLSYPQVVAEDGKIYMIPESCDFGRGDVSLYTTEDFPFGWKKVKTLIDRPFADSTLLKRDGHYYMACYALKGSERGELWHSESLLGPWERHPMWNKINQSIRLRRCGGRFLEEDGRLYRIAQDCNGFYGKRLFKVPVTKLSPAEYEEGPAVLLAGRVDAPCGYKHTYNEVIFNGTKMRVYDVYRRYWSSPIEVVRQVVARVLKKL